MFFSKKEGKSKNTSNRLKIKKFISSKPLNLQARFCYPGIHVVQKCPLKSGFLKVVMKRKGGSHETGREPERDAAAYEAHCSLQSGGSTCFCSSFNSANDTKLKSKTTFC